jgi:hypothetical protein
MRKLIAIGLSLIATAASAQTRTNCNTIGGYTNCTTYGEPARPDFSRLDPMPDFAGDMMRAVEQGRQQAQQREIMRQQQALIEQQRQLYAQPSADQVIGTRLGLLIRDQRCAEAITLAEAYGSAEVTTYVRQACPSP